MVPARRHGAQRKVDVSKAINIVLRGLDLPADMPSDLQLADIRFAANSATGYVSLSGRTAGIWKITNKIGVGIQSMSFERSGAETLAALVVSLEIGGGLIVLEAGKGGSDKGWTSRGAPRPAPRSLSPRSTPRSAVRR